MNDRGMMHKQGGIFAQKIRSSKVVLVTTLFLGLCATTIRAMAQTSQPRMNEPAVDEFGLERKSGRIDITTPVQIRIGGNGESELTLAYRYESSVLDFQGYREAGYPVIRYSSVSLSVIEQYDYYSIEYSGVSETFRRQRTSTGAFEPEYQTGATLVKSGNNFLFTDKFGVELSFDSSAWRITYPNGRTIDFNSNSLGTVQSIVNNFGYELRRYQSTIQAINNKNDYCDQSLAVICTGLQENRQSSYSSPAPTQRDFTDASGAVTRYRLVEIAAYERESVCNYPGGMFGGPPTCDTPYLASYYYPAGLKLPGSSTEFIAASYFPLNLPPAPLNPGSNISTLDDVRVGSITKDGVTADYSYTKNKYGTYGQSENNVPYRLGVATKVNNVQIAYTLANKPNSAWRVSGRRFLEYSIDGLNRRTDFGFNELKELSSMVMPEGNGQQLVYDSRFNVVESRILSKPTSGQVALVTRYSYPTTCAAATQKTCNLPLSVTDAKGNVTELTYNVLGQILTETKPASAPSAARTKVTNSYTMRTAYIRGAAGSVVPAGLPISLLTQTSRCMTLVSCTGSLDEVITAFDYGPATGLNNLLLRGVAVTAANAAGQIETQRTCFSYNYFGEKIAETQPKANLASCP